MVSAMRAVVCLSLCLCVCPVRGSHIPAEMNRTIQNLLLHYKIPNREKFTGTPVFSREPLAGRPETKRMFMGGVLETYEKLLGQMLEQLPTPTPGTAGAGANDVRMELNYILKKVQELRRHHYQEQSNLLRGLHVLGNIQMGDLVTQNKALMELPWLYEEASALSHNIKMQRRRRRRQAWKVRTHSRA